MPWPFDENITYPNLTDDEWLNAVMRGNPDYMYDRYYHHDSHATGRGPDRGWGMEIEGEQLMANFRIINVTLPATFPVVTGASLMADGERLAIIGMAAPSKDADEFLKDYADIGVAGMVSFLPKRTDKEYPLPFGVREWKDYAGDDQALTQAMTMARKDKELFKSKPENNGKIPTMLFHCAWGLGRTGTALSAYQLMSDIMEHRRDADCQKYLTEPRVKSVTITVHNYAEKIRRGGPSYIEVYTTPAVQLAINKIRRSTDPAMIAVEKEAQIRVLERYEEQIAFAMCQALGKLYPGPSQLSKSHMELYQAKALSGATDRKPAPVQDQRPAATAIPPRTIVNQKAPTIKTTAPLPSKKKQTTFKRFKDFLIARVNIVTHPDRMRPKHGPHPGQEPPAPTKVKPK